MENKLSPLTITGIYFIPLAIFTMAVYFSLNGFFTGHPELLVAMTLDLMVTAPLVYFLMIRKTGIPNFTAFTVFLIGTIIVSFVLPKDEVQAVTFVGDYFLPLIELGVLSLVLYTAYRMRKNFKSEKGEGDDAFGVIRKATIKSLGDHLPARLLTYEIAFIYYGLINWKKNIPKENEFTYHNKSGIMTIIGALIFIILIETFAIHFLLEQWSVIAAWILTVASIYAMFQMFAHAKATSRRFINMDEKKLNLKYGLFGDVSIPFSDIESVELTRKEPKDKEGVVKLALLEPLENHNTILHLKKEVTISGAYGTKKKGTKIMLFIDDKEQFETAVNERL